MRRHPARGRAAAGDHRGMKPLDGIAAGRDKKKRQEGMDEAGATAAQHLTRKAQRDGKMLAVGLAH